MKQYKHSTIIGAIFVILTGSLAHFLYDWSGQNPIVGLFTPINESIWEHMKLLFFPMFIYALFLMFKFKPTYPCITPALCFGILSGTFLIPLIYYTYTDILGKNYFVFDLTTFLLSSVIAFWLAYKLKFSCRLQPYALLLYVSICLLFVYFLVFTKQPPNIAIFNDPAQRAFGFSNHVPVIFK